MQTFATFDINGRATGFYYIEIHGGNIPADAIVISDGDYQAYLNEQGQWKRDLNTGERCPVPFVEPPVAIPQVISRFQGRAWLFQNNLLDAVENMMLAADPFTKLVWNETVEWHRESPTVAAMAQGLSKTSADIDQMFIEAINIVG